MKGEAPAVDDDEWQIKDDVRTLSRAAEILADKTRAKKAKALLAQQKDGLDKMMGGAKYLSAPGGEMD